jgi:hypothetical protein
MNHPDKYVAKRYDTPNRSAAFTDAVYCKADATSADLNTAWRSLDPPAPDFVPLVGEMHGHTNFSDGAPDVDTYFTNIRDVAKLDFAVLTDHDHGGVGRPELWVGSPSKWDIIREKAISYRVPGRFSTLLGYERDSYPFYNNLVLYFRDDTATPIRGVRDGELTEDELVHLSDTPLLTMKPVIYVANVSEDDAGGDPSDNAMYEALKVHAASEGAEVIAICAGIEAEIAELSGEEKQMFLDDLGIPESGLDRLIKKSYALLGLISYLTAGPEEVRAWTIVKGTKAPQAAGKIHSDFERGFIRAEVIAYDDLMRLGSMNAAKDAGLVRSEGKEYVMQDGDIVLFRFNV